MCFPLIFAEATPIILTPSPEANPVPPERLTAWLALHLLRVSDR
jgi:hypothetical protein